MAYKPTVATVPEGGTGLATLTAHSLQVGNGISNVTQLGVGTNGQVVIGSTGADPIFATIASSDSSITSALGAGTLGLTVTQATTTQLGGATFASDTEAKAVSITNKFVSPGNLAAVFGAPPALGSVTPANVSTTFLTVDNMTLDANTWAATNSNGNLVATPNGTGVLQTAKIGNAANTSHITMATTGEVTFPLQSSFLAYNSVADTNQTGDGTDATVEFDTEIADRNSDFASSTYTCPVTSLVALFTTVQCASVSAAYTQYKLTIVTSNRTYVGALVGGLTNDSVGQLTLNAAALCDMDAADTAVVKVKLSGSTKTVTIDGNTDMRTFFGGYIAV